jgi:ribonuclease R
VDSVEPSEQTESHRLIEFLMIAANEAVAGLLESRKLPALYRVHEPPDPNRVERLLEQLASLGVPTPPAPEHMTAAQAGALVEEAALKVNGPAFTSLLLRSLKQARYSPRNVGHFGLRSARYCHFTSPIRRYPDLICHRSLLSAIGAGEPTVRVSDLEAAGEWCSARERDAMSIERAADNVARAFLLEQELFRKQGWEREFTGEVVSVIGAGAFVAFDGYEGLLPVRKLGDDWWELNELETMLIATRTGKRIRLGDQVSVQVESIDAPRGRVDLLPVTL